MTAPWVIGSAKAARVLKIGHLTDVSGPYSANSGAVSIACARQAIEDFNPATKGMAVEYLIGDHQNNTDIALNIVREWFDRGDVDAAGGEQQRHRAGGTTSAPRRTRCT